MNHLTEPTPDNILEHLRAARAEIAHAELDLKRAVVNARRAGIPWADISNTIGVTRATAHRYAKQAQEAAA